MQQSPILRMKMYIPPFWPELASRSRRIERLNADLDRKPILVSALADFGETALATQGLGSAGVSPPGSPSPVRERGAA